MRADSTPPVYARGSYALVLRLTRNSRLNVGKLGSVHFLLGHYIYFGSALNGLRGRVQRHLRRDKGCHWHVDYLTSVATASRVWWVASPERMECIWAHAAQRTSGATVPAPGFGSSDCRCRSHLIHLESWKDVLALEARLAAEYHIQIWTPEHIGGGDRV